MDAQSGCSYEGFLQFRCRTNEKETLVDFFRTYGKETGFRSANRLISVGAGDGQLDSELIRHALPDLESYTAIECDEEMYTRLYDVMTVAQSSKLPSNTQVTIHTLNCPAEEYNGSEQAVDVVLMMHLVYYFGKRRGAMIEKAMGWLRPGGRLVIGVVGKGNILQKLANLEKDRVESWGEKVASDLRHHQLSYTEHEVVHEFRPAGCDRRFVEFVLGKNAVTDAETDAVLSFLPTQYQPGTSYIKHDTHIFVVEKPQIDPS